MPPPPKTNNEAGRLAELERYAILASPPEEVFDRITSLAARLFRCPIAVLNFIAGERQWFKSCIGLNFNESPRNVSLCAWAILSDSVMVVPDARQDHRFADNCFVIAEGGIRFYAGAPLVTPRGYNLGTLCIIDTQPRPGGMTDEEVATLRDLAAIVISELEGRLVAHEAEEVRDFLQTTLSSISDGVIATDVEGRVTFMNPAAQQLTAWSQEEARNKPVEQIFVIVNEVTRQPVQNPLMRALAEGSVIGLENRTVLLTKDGRELPIDDSAAPIRRTGIIVGGILIFRDVAVRRIAERMLEHSEQQFRNTFARAPLGMVLVEMDGRFIEANEAYRQITGYSQEELPSIGFISLTHPSEIDNNRALFRSLLAEKIDSYVLEKRIVTKPGDLRWVRAHATLLRTSDGKPHKIIGLVEDISARKEAEKKLAEASAELQIAHDKLQVAATELRRSNLDLSQFAHIASHDLRSPLNTVLQFSQLLERRFGEQLGSEGKEFLSFVTTSAKRMAILIDDLLRYAQVSAHSIECNVSVDAKAALDVATENLRSDIVKSATTITSDVLPSSVQIDATRLAQVFQNLIGNSIHYRGDETPRVHISAVEAEGRWLFSCKDNGIGIEPEFQQQIFEPFKRLHGVNRPGSGIGLAVCKKIVEFYQGRIWVESIPGRGSTFFFTLPNTLRLD